MRCAQVLDSVREACALNDVTCRVLPLSWGEASPELIQLGLPECCPDRIPDSIPDSPARKLPMMVHSPLIRPRPVAVSARRSRGRRPKAGATMAGPRPGAGPQSTPLEEVPC